jgi:hypothetical protein
MPLVVALLRRKRGRIESLTFRFPETGRRNSERHGIRPSGWAEEGAHHISLRKIVADRASRFVRKMFTESRVNFANPSARP